MAIFKRNSVYDPRNYRGVHLTCTMSKVAERVIGSPLVAYLEQHGFAKNQWAYRKQCNSRDLVLMFVTSSVLAICSGYKVAVYLSDIAGAFDRVFKDYLLAKLFALGVPDAYFDFLRHALFLHYLDSTHT